MAVIGCHHCGVGVDFDKVQPTPYKICPVCRAPLDEDAANAVSSHEAGNPADPKDGLRSKLVEQTLADVRGFQSEHQAAKAASVTKPAPVPAPAPAAPAQAA